VTMLGRLWGRFVTSTVTQRRTSSESIAEGLKSGHEQGYLTTHYTVCMAVMNQWTVPLEWNGEWNTGMTFEMRLQFEHFGVSTALRSPTKC
jgi:hypothetical protein